MAGVRPLARTVTLSVAGVLCGAAGVVFASPPAVAAGVVLVAAVLVDGLRFWANEARRPMPGLVRSVHPDPAPGEHPVTVRLRFDPKAGPAPAADLEETVPAELSSRMLVRPLDQVSSRGTELVYDLYPPHRGQWVLGPATVTRFSPLGLWWARVADRGLTRAVVWPRTVAMDLAAPSQERDGMVAPAGYAQPHQDNVTVRDYSPGDDLRRIHWRSSARRGELMTRAEEPAEADRAWAGLLVTPGTPADRRELAISLVASWLVAMAAASQGVDLACGGDRWRGEAAEQLTRLAVLTAEQAGRPLPAGAAEGAALLVVTGAGPLSADSLVPPPAGVNPSAGRPAIALVINGAESDQSLVASLGWSVLPLTDDLDLAAAGAALAAFVDDCRAGWGGR